MQADNKQNRKRFAILKSTLTDVFSYLGYEKIRAAIPALAISLVFFSVADRTLAQSNEAAIAPDASWREAPLREAEYAKGMRRTSHYIPMRDDVRLAVDVWLPVGLVPGVRLPAILEQTRYYRSVVLRNAPDAPCRTARQATVEKFVTRGYAYIVADVRGTGASFGTRASEYSEIEIDDGVEIVDWIIDQEWSDGTVGSQGQSYVGTAAELLASRRHPAVKAISPSFSGYDFYTEILFPGGVKNTEFAKKWSALIADFDLGELPDNSPIAGVCPVDADEDGSLLQAAIAEHRENALVWPLVESAVFRDDATEGVRIDQSGVFYRQPEIDMAGIPIHSISGWYDSGYALGALRRLEYSTAKNTALIGPWNHGGRYFYAPGVTKPVQSAFDMAAEKIAFFDYHLKGVGTAQPSPIRYYTSGASIWREAKQWPPKVSKPISLYFHEQGRLEDKPPANHAFDSFEGGGEAQSGPANRWRSTAGPYPVFYPDRYEEDENLLLYSTAPLEKALEVTGSPTLQLYLSTAERDADIFAYLEEVTPEGEVHYVSEGILRASRRKETVLPFARTQRGPSHLRDDAKPVRPGKVIKLDIELLPLSHEFSPGSRIRIALAPADRTHFLEKPAEGAKWKVFRGASKASHIVLPVADRSTE